MLTALGAILVSCGTTPPPPGPQNDPKNVPPAVKESVSWPQLRGPSGTGVLAAGVRYPTEWDARTGRNILWKTTLPHRGNSSPVVANGRIFLLAEEGREGRMLCLDAEGGGLLWDIPVVSATDNDVPPEMSGGLGASTPAVDERHVYALFATTDLVCMDHAGAVVWRRKFGNPVNSYGIATSLVLRKEQLLLQLDQGFTSDAGLSQLMALHVKDGTTMWSTRRDVPNSWSSPLVIAHDGREDIVTSANPWVIAYDAQSGQERWRVNGLEGDVVPMPTHAAGLVIATNYGSKVLCIRLGGSGDVTTTHVVWSLDEATPCIASPITDGQRLLLCGEGGDLTCYDLKTGAVIWKANAGEAYWASPILVGSQVYLMDKSGTSFVFTLGQTYQPGTTARLYEPINATPAFLGNGRILIRTQQTLYCIGEP